MDLNTLKIDASQTIGANVDTSLKNVESTTFEEKQLLGRFGVWLLVGLCTLEKEITTEILGRLLSMLFHWFQMTAYSYDGSKKSLIQLIFSVGKSNFLLIDCMVDCKLIRALVSNMTSSK